MEAYQKLTELIKQYENIVIMTHKNPDLDGLSSAIALHEIIKTFNKQVNIYKSDDIKNVSVLRMFKKLEENGVEIGTISLDEYKNIMDTSTLLIILDVNKIDLLENPILLDCTKNVIVIDHHIKSKGYIKDNIFTYINSRLSSIAEFMTNYIKYLNKEIDPLLATILLAAIEIDTNNFNIKTTADTYTTAAYLMKIGADNVMKQELLKENKKEYLKRQDLLKNSFMINKDTALCIFDDSIYKKEELAITAEELLQFEDVAVSYVVGKTGDNKVSISARSLGNIDVEKIMKVFGGGGHLTEAAAEIDTDDIKKVKKDLINEVIVCK